MRTIALETPAARATFCFWVEAAVRRGWNREEFKPIERALEEREFRGLEVTALGHLVLSTRLREGLDSAAVDAWNATLASHRFHEVKQEALVVACPGQLDIRRAHHRHDRSRILEYMSGWLADSERRHLTKAALEGGIVGITLVVEKRQHRFRPAGWLRLVAFREIADVVVETIRLEGVEAEGNVGELTEQVRALVKRLQEPLASYEDWVQSTGVRRYSLALRQALMTGVPLILIAFLADHLLHWLAEGNPWSLRASELVFRFLSGYLLTILAWLYLERQQGFLRTPASSDAPERAEVVVLRGAVVATVLGPLAVLVAAAISVSQTAPVYSVVAILNSSSDNLVAAGLQVLVHLRVAGQKARGLSTIRGALTHPFVWANVLAVLCIGAADVGARILAEIGQLGVFSNLGVITIEGVSLGFGDSLVAYFLLQAIDRRAFARVIGDSVRK